MSPRHSCARCGKLDHADMLLHSRHTGNRYCRALEQCARRAKRKRVAR